MKFAETLVWGMEVVRRECSIQVAIFYIEWGGESCYTVIFVFHHAICMDGNTNQGRPLVSCFVSCFCTAKRGKGCEIGIFLIVEKDCFQNYCTMHHQDLFFFE